MHPPLGLALVLAALAGAQQPTPTPPLPNGPFRGVFVADPLPDGATWVRGERYKLALHARGATFQPLFGPAAPRDFPLDLTLVAADVAGAPLPLVASAASPPWQRDGHRFTRERGAARECWQVAPGAAQQFFVVAAPGRAGPLTLRIGCASDLIAVDDGPGVRFAAPGLGEVRYSDAIVFDAAGARLDVPVALVADALVITVPAAFTARAAWPLLVDPLVTTVAVDTTISDLRDPRVACDPASGNWLVVAEEHLSATDVDIVCKRYDGAPAPALLDTTYADNTASFTHNPGVGIVATTQQFVVAWHDTAGNGSFRWRARSATSTTMNGPFGSSSGVGGDLANRPLIGSTLANDRFLLVLFRKNSTGTDVFAVLLRTTGTNFGTLFLGPVVSPSQGTVAPGGISTLASVADKWVVVWRECSSAACAQQTVRMQAVATTGGVGPLVPEPTIALATGALADEPAIAGHGGNLLAVWRAFDPVTLSNDLHGVPIGAAGTFGPLGAVQNLSAQEPNVNVAREQLAPAVSYDGVRFVYGYLEDDGNDTELPHAATVFVSGPSIAWHEGHLPLGAIEARTVHVAHGAVANPGVHWGVFEAVGGATAGDVGAAVIDARQPGPTSAVDQTGCGAPSEPGIALTGTPALGRTFTIALTNVVGFPILLVGPHNGSALPGCGGCSVGVDTGAMLLFAASSLSVAVPADPALIQFRLAFQGMVGGQAGGCPAALLGFPFAVSDTITIQVL